VEQFRPPSSVLPLLETFYHEEDGDALCEESKSETRLDFEAAENSDSGSNRGSDDEDDEVDEVEEEENEQDEDEAGKEGEGEDE